MIKPHFGDIIRNHWAGEKNPHRVGIFIRAGRRTGRLNPGPYWECTDGKGDVWQEGTANRTVEPTANDVNPLVALTAALERPHLCSPPESHEEAS